MPPAYAALQTSFDAAYRRASRTAADGGGRRAPERRRRGHRHAPARRCASAKPRCRASARRRRRSCALRHGKWPRPQLHRRQLHHPELHPDDAAGRARRPADRRDHPGGDRHDRRRAQLAVDRDGDRFLQTHWRPAETDAHYLAVSKIATGVWGVFACAVAVWAVELGSLIEVVNRFGSFFYGSILGVFILAVGVPRANGHGAFVGLVAGMGSVVAVVDVHDGRVPVAQRRRRGCRGRRRA